MKCRKAYGIMPVGENDRSAHVAQQKAPEVATPGLFYSVLGGWLNPKAGYQLFFSVQPFADVVGKVFEFYTEDYADTMSLAVFLISLAVSVYFAEFIRAVIPINLLLLLILVHIVYVLIRWYVKGCMRSRGYY